MVLARHSSHVGDNDISPGQTAGTDVGPRPTKQIQNRLSDEAVTRLLANRELGASIKALAAEFSIHRTTVLAILERKDVPRRSGVIVRNLDQATHLYQQGWSLAKVGRHFGVDAATVRRAFKSAQIAVRPRRGWQ